MAKPRVFVSSTYYDLRYLRASLAEFIHNLGYEPILFEKGDIPFQHGELLEESCVDEVRLADLFVLIVGGRYGSLSAEDLEEKARNPETFFNRVRSVTKKEYESARSRNVPIFIFVEENVLSEFKTYQKNKGNDNINYAHVDDIGIFEMIDEIFNQRLNNYVRAFTKSEDIVSWLRDQWAGMFSDLLRRGHTTADISNISLQISQLNSVIQSLQTYSETMVRKTEPADAEEMILAERLKQRSNLADAVVEVPIIQWFVEHDDTREFFDVEKESGRERILDALLSTSGLIEFLDHLGISGESVVMSMIGISTMIFDDFRKLKSAIEMSGLTSSQKGKDKELSEGKPQRRRRGRSRKAHES